MSGQNTDTPVKPAASEASDFPKTVVLSDGSEIPVGLPEGVDPEQAKLAVEYLKQNPQLAKHALRQADRLSKNPGLSPQLFQMQQAAAADPEYKRRMEVLKDDPELKPIFDEIATKGMDAIDKYWNNMEIMSKISKKMEELKLSPTREKSKPSKIKSLHDAAKQGDIGEMKKFLDKGSDINEEDPRGITPLGMAVGFNKIPAVEFLLKNGADFSKTDKQGNTVFHYAAGYGRLEIVKMLKEAGADASVQNLAKQTPLDVAKINRETSIISFLEE